MAHKDIYNGGLLDKNTYYPVGNITIFPSSNAVDGGKLFTEINGRNITINITDMNYVVSPNPGGYDIVKNNNMIDIKPGKAIINGFEVLTDTVISYRFPTESELYTGNKYAHKYGGAAVSGDDNKKYALLCLHTIFDSMENISGNVQVGDTWYCEGIHVCYPSAEEYESHENEYLLLGGVTTSGDVKINDEKFDRINADKILVRLEPDDETGVPPKQSTDLLTFINNFLHSYWVSKAGDHEYGNLTFRKKPNRYLNVNFDYKNEDPLNDKNYAIKIGRYGIDDASDTDVNENPPYQKGYINIKYCDNPEYLGYTKQTSIRPLGIFYKDNVDVTDEKNLAEDGSTEAYNVYTGYINGTLGKYYDIYGNDLGTTGDLKLDYNNTYVSRITKTGAENSSDVVGDVCYGDKKFHVGSFIWDSNIAVPTNFKIQFYEDVNYKNNIYVGAVNRKVKVNNILLPIQNDLFSLDKSIRTTKYNKEPINDDYNEKYFSIDLSAIKQQITFDTIKQNCYIKLRDDSDITNQTDWTNVLNIGHKTGNTYDGAVEIDGKQWIHQYLVVGDFKDCKETDPTGANNKITTNPIGTDPSLIEVPDIAHGGTRNIQDGDIYARQVWSAVYNDIGEMFPTHDYVIRKDNVGLLIAQHSEYLDTYTIADKYNTNIVGVISENPGICLGSNTKGVPVALAGRVKVRYEGPKIKPGDFVGLSKKIPGYSTKCWYFSKYRCGKVLRILDNDFIEILVLL